MTELFNIAAVYPIGKTVCNDGTVVFPIGYLSMETRGDRIKRLRVARGLTLDGLGSILGVTGAAVHKWETGDTQNMKSEALLLLADALGTDPKYLVWGENRKPSAPRISPPSAKRRTPRQ